MRMLALVLLVGCLAMAPGVAQTAVSATQHADAVKLVEISGARKRLVDAMPAVLDGGAKQFGEKCVGCSPAFVEEWKKRMAAQLSPDAFLQIYVAQYEQFFTDAELKEMISLQEKQTAGTPGTPTPELLAKLKNGMPAFMGKVVGACTEEGARVGGKVAEEIAKEHPEWTAGAVPKG